MIKEKTIKAIIPARMTSSRLPGKIMMDINGKPALQRVIERVRGSKLLDGIVIATTINKDDDCIEKFCQTQNVECCRGSENNVLERIIKAARQSGADIIVELTSDCPLIWKDHIDALINAHMYDYPKFDMTSNVEIRSFPRGFDLRIVNIEALERSEKEIDNDLDLQHALTWIYLNPKGKEGYSRFNQVAPPNEHRPDIEITLDTAEDLELLRFIYAFEGQGYNLELTPEQIIGIINDYPMMYKKVAEIKRKDYFAELQEWYDAHKNDEVKKKNEPVPSINNRNGRAGKRGRPAGKRK
jgi:spore coat polysaccharide biosynthesis protein SpsF